MLKLSRFTKGVRLALCLLSPLGLAGLSCGGRGLDDAGTAGGHAPVGGRSGGGAPSGGASSGGVNAGGGRVAVGGSSSSGGQFPSDGGSIGGAGGSSVGGASGLCVSPPVQTCEQDGGPLVYFDDVTNTCRSTRGVCFGEDTFGFAIFPSLVECLATCAGATPSAEVCDVDTECQIAPTCCGPCAPAELGNFSAVNKTVDPAICNVLCGACPEVPEIQQNLAQFVPMCENHVCTVVDLTQSRYAECERESDCFLRDGAGCCTECDGQGFIPLSSTSYLGSTCAAALCPACVSGPPLGIGAQCNPETLHCEKVELLLF